MPADDLPPPDVVELHGGPLDGRHITLIGWTPRRRADGIALTTPHGAYGPGGRSWYRPDPDDPSRWIWERDTP
ncbi:MAG TPA: hypothetical protein VGS97_10315 [Actinocrinis sp.]|uniref:hypothetical protein n=1 Tax=Actinocrinis sp. TaxID=1920516 RepID=UPI002DDCF23B|nr:hypothetical protein [Actinocrinis sp.]HEV2344474.1 hypothetical protein [Actinocrinis sp.]